MVQYVSHEYIKENTIERRLYQEVLSARIIDKGNSLVVAPTALGKTIVAALVSAFKLKERPEQKILFLAPTKPLAIQHEKSFKNLLNVPEERISLLTGSIPAEKRKEVWENSGILCATPQSIENDLITGRIDLKDVSLIIFDESHRAVGNYAYVFIAGKYRKDNNKGLVLGLTASPGSEEEKISDVCKNLFIENIEVKTHRDEDVKPYVNEIKVEWEKVNLPPEFLKIKKLFKEFIKQQIIFLKKIGYSKEINSTYYSQKDLLSLQSKIRKDMMNYGKEKPSLYIGVSRVAALLKVSHAHTLLETQGIKALNLYLDRMLEKEKQAGASKALKFLLKDENIIKAIKLSREANEKSIDHPKLVKLAEIIKKEFKSGKNTRVLVFNHFRDSIGTVVNALNELPGINARKFIGQATKGKDKGMSQKEQIKILQEFREGKYNVLVASSVAEEGLDIPSVDLVVFFEPVPSEIRSIQRIGRTGRFRKGRAVILMAKNTRDEGFYWASIAKERRMHKTLKDLRSDSSNITNNVSSKTNSNLARENQTTLNSFMDDDENQKLIMYIDSREQSSEVVKRLFEKDAMIKIKQLEVGDYILTDQIVVERKTTEDFLTSLIDGRLFSQLLNMSANYDSPLLLIEGNMDDLFTLRNIHKHSVIGALTSIALTYRTPFIFTKNAEETADYLYLIAKREQIGKNKDIKLRVGRKGLTLPEQQQFIIESFPLVGPTLARNLLKEFGSIKNIMNACEKDLQKVEKVGSKKAKGICKLIDAAFEDE